MGFPNVSSDDVPDKEANAALTKMTLYGGTDNATSLMYVQERDRNK